MHKRALCSVGAIVLSAAFSLMALQAAAQPTQAKKIVEVEKGFFTGIDGGYVLPLSGAEPLKKGFLGSMVIGYDIIDSLSLDLGLSYLAMSSGGPEEKDGETLAPGDD